MAVTQQFIAGTPGTLDADVVVAGRYRIVAKLGEGGMGAVYRAVQEPLGREVALKVIAPALATDADAVERFRREAKAASSLSHPHIVTVFDFGADGGQLFIAMELITGEGLDDVVKRGPMPARRAIPILRSVSTALAEAHARGIVHRDLKPPNVMLTSTSTQQDVVKVVDFGIARMAEGGGRTLTQTGAVVGTAGYVAPELFDGAAPSASSDLYALGVVAYELLGGTAPFPGGTPLEILKAVLFGEPTPLRAFARDLPPGLDTLVMALLEKDPAKRPASARDVDAALAAIQSAPLDLPPLPPVPGRLVPPSSPSLASPPSSLMTPSTAVIMTETMVPPPPSDHPARPVPPPASSVPVPSGPPAPPKGGVPGWVVAVGALLIGTPIVVVAATVVGTVIADTVGDDVTVDIDPHTLDALVGRTPAPIAPNGEPYQLHPSAIEALREAGPEARAAMMADARATLADPGRSEEERAVAGALLGLLANEDWTAASRASTPP